MIKGSLLLSAPIATLKFIDYNVAMTFILIIIIIIVKHFQTKKTKPSVFWAKI